MSGSNSYSVSKLSKMSGITVRTLHHYDRIGLLKPARRLANGYREYEESQLVLLQQILIFRELDFSLENIKSLLKLDPGERLQSFQQQKALLIMRQHNTQTMIDKLEVSMNSTQSERNLEILYEGIPKAKAEQWNQSLRERLGDEVLDFNQMLIGQLSEEEARDYKDKTEYVFKSVSENLDAAVDEPAILELARIYTGWLARLIVREDHMPQLYCEVVCEHAYALEHYPECIESVDLFGQGTAHKLYEILVHYAHCELPAMPAAIKEKFGQHLEYFKDETVRAQSE